MKKLYLFLFISLIGLAVSAQQVGRQKVIVEIATGTWCQYCPGAALGADDLYENGCEVGIIEYHNGDPYTNTASDYRNSYYGVSGYPTAHFDGVLEYVGGSHTESMYPNYLPLYQQRMAINSDFTIDIYGQATGSTYNIQLVINQVAGSWGNLTVHLVLTESEIVYSWQGQDHLNFVERLMSPDHMGTVVDFSSIDETTLNLTFTMDASWVTDNCALVAFIQNEATKECLQGNMVLIPDLEPMQATAGFTCDNLMPCITTPVEFEDQSLGDIITWNWAFEGGNPPTSSVQNPTVTYAAQGEYDVRLIVYDGEVYDTLLNPNYILAITNPVQPPTPAGPVTICQDYTNITYSIAPVQYATTYVWGVDPPSAGTISGPDPVATFTPSSGFLGNYTIKVRADNNCGQGTWSPGLNCTAHVTPTQYTLSDGSGYCEGGDGIELTLDGSEEGVNYEIYLDGDATGQIVAGTGSPLDFGSKTEQGIYTCVAFTDFCDKDMVGNAYIFVIHAPDNAETPSGPAVVCSADEDVIYTTDEIDHATTYDWLINPSEAGTVNGNSETVTIDWNPEFSGTANITVAGVNSCFTGEYSDNLAVTVNITPQPAISGDQEVCNWSSGNIYSTTAADGNTYTWEINNGTITNGQGTNEVTVSWGYAGSGYVKVTEANGTCTNITNNFDIVIDDCTGIGEGDANSFSIFPNPVKDALQVRFNGKAQDNSVVIINQLGETVSEIRTGGSQEVLISTVELANGVYILRVIGENSTTDRKFIKID